MTANVAMPTSTPKPVATGAHAAAGKTTQPGAADASGQEGFDQQFNQVMRQQAAGPALPAAVAPPVLPPKVALASIEPANPLTGKDDANTDPAEREGNALAAAVLAMLGQGVAAQAKVAGSSQGQSVSADAGKGGAQRGLPGLVTDAAKDAGAIAASAPAVGVDASALVAAATASAAPETRKSTEPGNIEALAAPMNLQAPAANATAPAAHALQMNTPAGNAGFAQELGQQVAWLGGQEIKQARIRLRPEELGQLDVKVSVAEHGRVDVSFTAQHPAAVTAVQQTLGQLDLMLAGHGLSLGQAQVGQQGGQGAGQGQAGQSSDGFVGDVEPNEPSMQRVAVGLLDTFA